MVVNSLPSPSALWYHLATVRRESARQEMLKYSRIKNEGTYRSGAGGGESPLCDPGSELLLGGGAGVVRGS